MSKISKAMLSDIEKGNSNPTINTIWKIANGLNVPYTKLMEGIERKPQSSENQKLWPSPVKQKTTVCIVILKVRL